MTNSQFPDAIDSMILMEQAFSRLWEGMYMLLPDPQTAYSYAVYDNPETLVALLNEWCLTCHSLFYLRGNLIFNQSRLNTIQLFCSQFEEMNTKLSVLQNIIKQTNTSGIDHIARTLAKLAELTITVYRDENQWLGEYLLPVFSNFIHYSVIILEGIALTKLWWSALLHFTPQENLAIAQDVMPKSEQSKKLHSYLFMLITEISKWDKPSIRNSQIIQVIEEFNIFLHRFTGDIHKEPVIIHWKNPTPSPGKPWINVKNKVSPPKHK
jgi:hypothetical protein